MWRSTPPHSPAHASPTVYGSGALACSSMEKNQAKPSATISIPIRLSGRRRHAYRPVPTKLQPTTGPKIAHATSAS